MWGKVLAVGKKFVADRAKKKAVDKASEAGGFDLASLMIKLPFIIGTCFVVAFFIIIIAPLVIIPAQFGNFHLLQSVDPAYASQIKTSVDLNYDYEAMLAASESAPISPNSPATDLASTEYKNVDGFNQHIKDCVETAGYGTRAGVVAAGKCLVSDYIDATGYRLRYSQSSRLDSHTEGITDDTYMDCSSFAWWALYNGGFKIPEESCCYTVPQLAWGLKTGIATQEYTDGQPGDFLIYDHGGGNYGHARLIIGTYDDGYYIAEFSDGGQISKTPFSGIPSDYYLFHMDSYYSDSNNVR